MSSKNNRPHVTCGKSCAICLSLWWNYGFSISIIIQHGGTWLCFKQYKLMHNLSLHTSVFSGSSEISKYLYYSTDNCMLTWGNIGVACYFWMTLYLPVNQSSVLPVNQSSVFIYLVSKTCDERTPTKVAPHRDILMLNYCTEKCHPDRIWCPLITDLPLCII